MANDTRLSPNIEPWIINSHSNRKQIVIRNKTLELFIRIFCFIIGFSFKSIVNSKSSFSLPQWKFVFSNSTHNLRYIFVSFIIPEHKSEKLMAEVKAKKLNMIYNNYFFVSKKEFSLTNANWIIDSQYLFNIIFRPFYLQNDRRYELLINFLLIKSLIVIVLRMLFSV